MSGPAPQSSPEERISSVELCEHTHFQLRWEAINVDEIYDKHSTDCCKRGAVGRTEPLGPIFWLVTLSLGLFVNRYMRHRSAPWIGLFGITCLTILLVWDYIGTGHSDYYRSLPGRFWGDEFRQNFTSKCSNSECLGLLITMPSLSLVAYSIGAWLGLTLSLHSRSRNPQ